MAFDPADCIGIGIDGTFTLSLDFKQLKVTFIEGGKTFWLYWLHGIFISVSKYPILKM
jgi:hypothetical protein